MEMPGKRIGKLVQLLADAGGMQGEQRRSGKNGLVQRRRSIRAGEVFLRSYVNGKNPRRQCGANISPATVFLCSGAYG